MNKKTQPARQLGFLGRLILCLSLCLVLCLGLVIGGTQITTRRTMQQNALETGKKTIDNRATLLELNLAQISKLASNLYSNADVYSLLRQDSLDMQQAYRITLFLRSMMSMSADVDLYQIYLDVYSSKQSFIITADGSSSNGVSRYSVKLPDYIESGDVYCEGPHLASNYGGYSVSSGSAEVFSFHWALYDNAQTNIIGTISYDVRLDEMLTYVFPNESEYGFLMSGNDIIFQNQVTLTNQQAADILATCEEDGWGEVHTDTFHGIAFYSTVSLNNVDLQLVQMIPNSELYADANRLLRTNLLTIFLAFLLCALIIAFMVHRLFRPIRELDSCLQRIESEDDLGLRVADEVNYHANDEIGRLIRQTDNMLDTVEDLFERQKMLSQAQRDAEAKMLQAQINPHFLYNSLQSLASLALQRGQKDIFRYITMLGNRMHYSMDMESTSAELRQEFDYVDSYLILQNVRFGNGMQSDIRLSPEAENIAVPRMILQPLAENAFKHGKLCRTPGTYLKLIGEVKNEHLIIVMENNGLEVPPERMAELNAQFAAPGVSDYNMAEHIGMLSVLYRLRLFFNDRVTMVMEKPEGASVRITIDVPL